MIEAILIENGPIESILISSDNAIEAVLIENGAVEAILESE